MGNRSSVHSVKLLWWCIWPLIAASLIIFSLNAVGEEFLNDMVLDFGSITIMKPLYTYYMVFYGFLGIGAVGFLALGISRIVSIEKIGSVLTEKWICSSDRKWVVFGAIFAFVIPFAIRFFILEGAAITEDESGYRFLAQLLASGRLKVDSPPLKMFFDNQFMINDGHFYPQYFVGWPLLLVPGVMLNISGYMNAFYSAAIVPGLFFVIRRVTNGSWAKAGVLLYLTSPMMMIGAATELSHTTCLLALVWQTWFVLRSFDDDAPWWAFCGAAFFFSLAFMNRPLTAISIGLPILGLCLYKTFGLSKRKLVCSLISFVLPALIMATLFLMVNRIQNGSFFLTSYQRYLSYVRSNGNVFSGLSRGHTDLSGFSVNSILSFSAIGLVRLNFALFGWPFSFLFMVFSCRKNIEKIFWFSFVFHFLIHAWNYSSGIDTFGPVKHFELALPVIVLSVVGLKRMVDYGSVAPAIPSLGNMPSIKMKTIPICLFCSLILLNLGGYFQMRLACLSRIADNINSVEKEPQRQGIKNAIIFSSLLFTNQDCIRPTRHFRVFHSVNDPDLKNDILWVNDLGYKNNRKLMSRFPERTGYVKKIRPDCKVEFVPLERISNDKNQ